MSDGYTTPPNAFSPESEDLRVAEEWDREGYEDSEESEKIKIEPIKEEPQVEEIRVGNNSVQPEDFCSRLSRNYTDNIRWLVTEYNRILTKPQIIRIDRYIKNALMHSIRKYAHIVGTVYSQTIKRVWGMLLQPKNVVEFLESIRFKSMITDRNLVLLYSMLEEINSYFGPLGCIYSFAIMLNVYKFQIGVAVDMAELQTAIFSFMSYLQFTITDPEELIHSVLTHDPLVTLRVILERGSEL